MKRAFDAVEPDRKCQTHIKNVGTALTKFAATEPEYTRIEEENAQKRELAVELMDNMNKVLVGVNELLNVIAFQKHEAIFAYLTQFKEEAEVRFAQFEKVATTKV